MSKSNETETDATASLGAQLANGVRALGTKMGLFYGAGAVVIMLYRWWGEWLLAEGMIGQSGHTVGWAIFAVSALCIAFCALLDFRRGMRQTGVRA